MKELFEHVKDKILAFLKAVGLYKRIWTFNIPFMYKDEATKPREMVIK